MTSFNLKDNKTFDNSKKGGQDVHDNHELSKDRALEVCKTCSKRLQKGCIVIDIEHSGEYVSNPPECLTTQFRQSSAKPDITGAHSTQATHSENNQNSGKIVEKIVENSTFSTFTLENSTFSTKNKQQDINSKEGGEGVRKSCTTVSSKKTDNLEKVENSTISQENSTFSTKKSGKSGVTSAKTEPELSKAAQRFYKHLKNGIISTKTLMHIEKCKKSNVYKYLNELRKKGYIDQDNKIVEIRRGTHPGAGGEGVRKSCTTVKAGRPTQEPPEGSAQIKPETPAPYQRVHSHQFVIDILDKTNGYDKMVGDHYYDDGNRVQLNKNTIEVYAQKDRSWDAATVDEAVTLSMDYFGSVFARVQSQCSVTLLKNRVQNIHLRKVHVGFTDHPTAKDVVERGDRFRIYHEDGRLRMIIDASHLHPEMETVSNTAIPDMQEVERHYKDLLEKHPLTNSEITALMEHMIADTVAATVKAATEIISESIKEQGRENLKMLLSYQMNPQLLQEVIKNQLPELLTQGTPKKQTQERDPIYG